ncbi:DMT family transporter [Alkaliphilus peptidifermentans]|uniref:Permease of the drug/metabolite transporter (DMT) superfamily n=1 Tax=Alkaliphilus peptidifermentans DSM 18978 TaxID=1120976 RepID=A0A1G5K3E8_9FIRM|nr:DMT family transporter [Alkaliphilus peptidifermentans]SCY94984.1 Permease of the drug/metabolite transporter (DMT) superfamily [Alkaliphilus peptidifermentans DSM 18978]
MSNINTKRVYSILLLGVIGISFSAILIRNATAPASIIAMYRMIITFFLFIPVALVKSRNELAKTEIKDYILCCISGIFLALHFISWITSLSYTTVASSTVLVSMQPIFTSLIAYLIFKEGLSKKGAIGMTIAIFGSAVIGISNFHLGEGSIYGDTLALMGGLFGALYITIGRSMRKKISNLTYGFLVYGSCGLVILIINLTLKVPLIGYPEKDYMLFALMAIICTIGGHTVLNWGLKYVEASKISTFMLGEPVGATLWAILLLREYPSSMQIIGGIIILFGLYIFISTSLREDKSKKKIVKEGLELES